jgi:hypothetical protein
MGDWIHECAVVKQPSLRVPRPSGFGIRHVLCVETAPGHLLAVSATKGRLSILALKIFSAAQRRSYRHIGIKTKCKHYFYLQVSCVSVASPRLPNMAVMYLVIH